MELYMDTLGQLQCLIDQSDSEVPIIIMGDFNTVLPDTESLTEKWFCRKPYNKRSGILYEFLVQNDLCVLNFLFRQSVSYTYSQGSKQSYIDHIVVPRYLCEKFLDCNILNKAEDNVSDHFAINASIDVPGVKQDDENFDLGSKYQEYPRARWDDVLFQKEYCKLMLDSMQSIPTIQAKTSFFKHKSTGVILNVVVSQVNIV